MKYVTYLLSHERFAIQHRTVHHAFDLESYASIPTSPLRNAAIPSSTLTTSQGTFLNLSDASGFSIVTLPRPDLLPVVILVPVQAIRRPPFVRTPSQAISIGRSLRRKCSVMTTRFPSDATVMIPLPTLTKLIHVGMCHNAFLMAPASSYLTCERYANE